MEPLSVSSFPSTTSGIPPPSPAVDPTGTPSPSAPTVN